MLKKFSKFVEFAATSFNDSYTYPAHRIKRSGMVLLSSVPVSLIFMYFGLEKSENKVLKVAAALTLILCLILTVLCGGIASVLVLLVAAVDIAIGRFLCGMSGTIYNEEG